MSPESSTQSEFVKPTDHDVEVAAKILDVINNLGPTDVELRLLVSDADQVVTAVDLPRPAADLFLQMINNLAKGRSVSLLVSPSTNLPRARVEP